jgi:6-pyruvoyltetrahydropterin/6-carboxytetrahydropterin synthase
MGVLIRRRYFLETAHRLTAGVPDHHKCRRMHGHRYEVVLTIEGELDADGILIEYADLDRVVWPVLKLVDHHCLNDLFERCSTNEAAAVSTNPTVERLVRWIGTRLAGIVASTPPDRKLRLAEVFAQEDAQSGALWVP